MWMMVADPEENIEADVREAAALTERLSKVMVRVLGKSHPVTKDLLLQIKLFAHFRRACREDPSFLPQRRREFKQQFAGPAGEELIESTKRDFANSRLDPSQHWPYYEEAASR